MIRHDIIALTINKLNTSVQMPESPFIPNRCLMISAQIIVPFLINREIKVTIHRPRPRQVVRLQEEVFKSGRFSYVAIV